MSRGRLVILTLTAIVASVSVSPGAASGAGRVYWSNGGGSSIAFARLDGKGGKVLSTPGVTPSSPEGIAIDAAAGRIYWGEETPPFPMTGRLAFARLDGKGGAPLIPQGAVVDGVVGVALDSSKHRIYWGNDGATPSIWSAGLNGAGAAELPTDTATAPIPEGLAIDPTAGRLYWGNQDAPGGPVISFARLNGTGGRDVNTAPAAVGFAEGLAVDPVSRRIYWSSNKISSARVDGTGGGADLPTPTVTVNNAEAVAIDPVTRKIYWSDAVDNAIRFARLDGSAAGTLPISAGTANDPGFLAILAVPRPTKAPAISGGSSPGKRLTCSRGSWAPDVPQAQYYRVPRTFLFRWTTKGKDLPGATASSLKATKSGTYRCRVTAANASGSATRTSGPHKVFPDTKILKSAIAPATGSATFKFKAVGGAAGFQCALSVSSPRSSPAPHFSSCKSPKTLTGLTPGKYVFQVRAVAPVGRDPTPASKHFTL